MKCIYNLHKVSSSFVGSSYSPVLMAHCKRIIYIKVYIHTHIYMYRLSIIYVVCGKFSVTKCVHACAFVCVRVCVYARIAGTPACVYCVISICMCV